MTVYTNSRSSPMLQGHWKKESYPKCSRRQDRSSRDRGFQEEEYRLTCEHPFKKLAFLVTYSLARHQHILGLQVSSRHSSVCYSETGTVKITTIHLKTRNRKDMDQDKQQNRAHEVRQPKAHRLKNPNKTNSFFKERMYVSSL